MFGQMRNVNLAHARLLWRLRRLLIARSRVFLLALAAGFLAAARLPADAGDHFVPCRARTAPDHGDIACLSHADLLIWSSARMFTEARRTGSPDPCADPYLRDRNTHGALPLGSSSACSVAVPEPPPFGIMIAPA